MALRQILLPWDSQPRESAQIDWSNPITSGLVAASISGGSPGDLTVYSAPNGYTVGIGKAGVEAITTIASTQYFETNGGNRITTLPFTAVAVIRPAALATQAVFNAYTSPTEYHELYLTSAGAAVLISAVSGGASATAAGAYAANETLTLGGRVSSATERSVWKNGVQLASNATSKSPSAAVNNRWGLWNGTTERFGGGWALRLVWGRALSDAEMAEIGRNPWQVFEPASILVPVPATGGITGASSQTIGLTGSATGTVATAGASEGPLVLAGSAAAAVAVAGASAQTIALTGAAAGVAPIGAASAATLALLSLSAGQISIAGASAGTLTLAGTATGTTTGAVSGASDQVLPIGGIAAGTVAVAGTSTAQLQLSGSAAGTVGASAITGQSAITLGLTGSGAGQIVVHGVSTAVVDLVATPTQIIATSAASIGRRLSTGQRPAATSDGRRTTNASAGTRAARLSTRTRA